MKNVVVGIAFKTTVQLEVLIMTQLRKVQNKAYDPLYDNTWEAMGETMNPNEHVIDALVRGCREEWGQSDDWTPLRILGSSAKVWTTGKGDTAFCHEPFCLLQNVGPPQPWYGPCFLVQVARDFEPNFALSDGEASDVRWWKAPKLKRAIKQNPQQFMGWHIPALYKFCELILKKDGLLPKL